MITIDAIRIDVDDEKASYRAVISADHGLPSELSYRVASCFAAMLTDRVDPALLALLVPAMLRGVDLHVRPPVSAELLMQLDELQETILLVSPKLQVIRVFADKIKPTEPSEFRGIGTGFSAGIDSYAEIAEGQATHLLYNNVGSHGRGEDAARLFSNRSVRIKTAAEALGLPLVLVDSNVDAFYDYLTFEGTHTIRNASVAHLLAGGLQEFRYASAFSDADTHLRPAGYMAFSDRWTLPLMSTPTLRLRSVGGSHSRVEKTALVADHVPSSRDHLDVCVHPPRNGGNCSACFKCRRTLLTLDLLGKVQHYQGVFDLRRWRRDRPWCLAETWASDSRLEAEITALARDVGLHPSRLALATFPTVRRTGRIVRRIKRGISRRLGRL